MDSIYATEKSAMRELAMRGGQYSVDEQTALVSYCETDVDALAKLLPAMLPQIDLPRALLRGRYMAAVARMEAIGVPIDLKSLHVLRARWGAIQDQLIAQVDHNYGVYVGRTFKADRFGTYLRSNHIRWPYLRSGALALDRDTFREQAKVYKQIAPLCELRHSLSGLRLEALKVGSDKHSRCLLSPFASKAGRNQPSTSQFIFGPAVWIRGLIQPAPGFAVAYLDWAQQEFGVAAALSGDQAMMQAYSSDDPYLAFAVQAGAVPKKCHQTEPRRYPRSIQTVRLGCSIPDGSEIIGQPPRRLRSTRPAAS